MPKTANETEQAAATPVGRIVNPSVSEQDGLTIRPATSANVTHPSISLNASYRYCKRLARRTGRNFYFSFLTLPRKQFRAMCALYAFMRVCDDLGDDATACEEEKARNLREWRRQLDEALGENGRGARGEGPATETNSGSNGPSLNPQPSTLNPSTDHQPQFAIFPALVDTVQAHAIPHEYLHHVIEGVEADVQPRGFETFEDLNRYCYRVAGAVGLCCVHIWGFEDERAIPLAVDCGTAFQLTNILRDLGEDAAMGRCYLPREDLRRFDLAESDIAAGCRDDRFHRLMQFEVRRAREYYAKAGELFEYIQRPGRPILSAMLQIYGGLLEEIERRDYDVFSRRVSLSRARKLRIALRAVLRHRVLRR